ncbi:MAG: DUF3089 domain-containing protein [Alphaproteobacteria bacterium]|nr:MAG: DUF3089 domain-containing protein [Alphaproteobacteria bacterium]
MPSRPGRCLRPPAPHRGAQHHRLRLARRGKAGPGGEGRLLLRLPDRVARSRPQQRLDPRPRGAGDRPGPARPLRHRLPDLRSDLPPGDAGRDPPRLRRRERPARQGRPFVLIGHSQGSVHLIRLLREEVEGKPEAKRMLSAIVLGWAVEVPPGKTVGGSFKSTPLCTRAGETGCVITYMSFRASSPPPDPSFLGRAAMQGMTAACTNPAALGGGRAKLDSYWFAMRPADPGSTPIVWSSQGAPATPFVRTEGLATGECVHSGSAGYLAIDVDADPVDARTDTIPGDVYIGGQVAKSWGMHLADMNVAQGDLIRLVEAQAAAFSASATPATHSKAKPPKAHRR